ncbi:ATP-binding protein [Streptomyces sp. NPDC001852]|uniref:ATP-binding protein n=1 Tax=Streptomyces sp. NPDC001852 TaxID=3364619 RepID=UPI00367CDE5F
MRRTEGAPPQSVSAVMPHTPSSGHGDTVAHGRSPGAIRSRPGRSSMHFATCKFQLAGCGAFLAGATVDSLLRPTQGAGGADGLGETGPHQGLVRGPSSAARAVGPTPHPHARPDERRTAMAPPFLSQPLRHPPEHRSPAQPPLPAGPLRLPVVPHENRPEDRPAPPPAAVQRPGRTPTRPSRPDRAPDSANRPTLILDHGDDPHPAPDSAERRGGWGVAADGPGRRADTAGLPERSSEGTKDDPHPSAGAAEVHPHPASEDAGECPQRAPEDTDDLPQRASQDTGERSLPGPEALNHARRPPSAAGVPRPPGGGRLGRLPGPLGPDRLASGDPPPRSAAAFELPAQPSAVGTARRVVEDLLTAWGVPDGPRADALLVTSELVTNALVHAAGARIACRLRGTADRIRIEVEDQDGGPTLPVARRPAPDDQHGRGLFLVDALSRDWGVTPVSGRPARVVWAELPSGHDRHHD